MSKKERILVTSALPYVNNVPHLGNIIGCVLSADVFARFCRSKGLETLYVCGTDEHGTTTEAKALEEGLTPKQLCDKYYKIHKDVYQWFNISFDHFGRTSDKTHHEVTQEIFKQLYKNGFIAEEKVKQLYCEKCKKFLADRFIEGTCPYCGSKNARGDQCEDCGRLLDPLELIGSRCKICDSQPKTVESKHLFLDLPKLQPKLEKWVAKTSKQGFWTNNAKKITNSWFKEGLTKRCISRDLEWGINIPLEGYQDKVFYVWFDAPIGYISITKSARKDWQDWWKDSDTKLYQFMAKDNVPFHSILFPGILIGTKEEYTLLYHLDSTEYLNYEDSKFSKSRGTGIFGDDALKTGIPSDVWRYYLLTQRPEDADTVFSWDDFQSRLNNELIANFGNYVNRVLSFVNRFLDSELPKINLDEEQKKFLVKVKKKEEEVTGLLNKVKERNAIKEIIGISRLGNQYFQKNEIWNLIKTDKKQAVKHLYILTILVKDLAVLIEPFLPETSSNIFRQLNLTPKKWGDLGKASISLPHRINKAEVLFKKIEDKEIKEFKEKFKGKKTEKKEDDPFSLINLKVAEVTDVEDHPDADRLYILNISLGKEKRQLVAGLKPDLTKEQILNKHIVIISNLKPAKLKGVESQGMLLAADKNNKVVLLEAPDSKPGTQVFIEGITPKQDTITINQFAKLELRVRDKQAVYSTRPLRTDKEIIIANIEDNAKIQ